jgi:hypothetical protein
VTQTADVAVNIASRSGVRALAALATGRMRGERASDDERGKAAHKDERRVPRVLWTDGAQRWADRLEPSSPVPGALAQTTASISTDDAVERSKSRRGRNLAIEDPLPLRQ